MQLKRFIGTEKSKKPLIRFAKSSSIKPDSALSGSLNISLMGAAAILKITTQLSAAAMSRKTMAKVSI
jgi:hypothetical protein